jgi:uncharacterized membrane protein
LTDVEFESDDMTTPPPAPPGAASAQRVDILHPRDWVDRLFLLGIVGKGLDALGEIIGGTLLLILRPVQMRTLIRLLTQDELSEDPHDVLAQWLTGFADRIDVHALTFGAVYLLAHGIVKIVLVIALLRNRLWAYPWMIAVLLAFIAYQVYRIVTSPTAGMIALTIFDLVVTVLTVIEYRRQRTRG